MPLYSLWLHKWLIAPMLIDFPMDSALRIWDLFLTEGLIFNLKFIADFMIS